jgi:electron transfer flavoprotein beta subunit
LLKVIENLRDVYFVVPCIPVVFTTFHWTIRHEQHGLFLHKYPPRLLAIRGIRPSTLVTVQYANPLVKIAVCVKHVPSGHLQIDIGLKRLDRSSSGEINNVDLHAIEAALHLREESAGEIVAISMGQENAVETLRTALALGADRAVLVVDDALEGSDLTATSRVLSAVLDREEPDLILFGQQSCEGSGAMLWAAVAERLRLPVISQTATLAVSDGVIRVVRQSEVGDDVIEARLPAVVAVSDALNEPRYASLKGMMGAKRKPLERLSIVELGLSFEDVGEAGSGTEVLGLAKPSARSGSRRLAGDDATPQAILDYLIERQVI